MRLSPRSGFTLVEVVVAILVFAVGVVGAAALLHQSARTISTSRRIDEGTVLLAEVADSLTVFGIGGGGEREGSFGIVTWEVVSVSRGQARVELRWIPTGRDPAEVTPIVALLPVTSLRREVVDGR